MILSKWLNRPRDNMVASYDSVPMTVWVPTLSPMFPLLIIMALPFLINPASNLKQEGQLFQFRSSQWEDSHRTWAYHIQGDSIGPAIIHMGSRGKKQSETRYKCGRRPMPLSNSSQRKILMIQRKKCCNCGDYIKST